MGDATIRSFRDLDAWKVAMELTMLVYDIVTYLPGSERFELSAQLRRASVSVPSNVAEGQSCGADGRYIHHLRIAIGSLGELATQIEIARRLRLLPEDRIQLAEAQITRTAQLLYGLLRSRRKKRARNALALLVGFLIGAVVFTGMT